MTHTNHASRAILIRSRKKRIVLDSKFGCLGDCEVSFIFALLSHQRSQLWSIPLFCGFKKPFARITGIVTLCASCVLSQHKLCEQCPVTTGTTRADTFNMKQEPAENPTSLTDLEVFEGRGEFRLGLGEAPVGEQRRGEGAEEVGGGAQRREVGLVVVQVEQELHQRHRELVRPARVLLLLRPHLRVTRDAFSLTGFVLARRCAHTILLNGRGNMTQP